jgi:ribosomal protein L37AE/L43A
MEIISYELKYCERCGTLKLRPIDSGSAYCRHCEGVLARYTFPHGTRGKSVALRSAPEKAFLAQIPLRCVSHRVAEVAK